MLHVGDFPTEACCNCPELDQLRWTGSSRCSQVLCSCWRDGRLFPGPMHCCLFGLPLTLWRRYLNEFSSPVVSFRRLPRSLRNPIVSGPQAPDDSMAMGVNVYVESRHPYLPFFLFSAKAATAPAALVRLCR